MLGWDSPVKEVVHPSFINLNNRGGLGWLEGFNEWLCRCGMEWNGQPGTDRFVNNTGEETTMDLTLHGRIANLPAQEVELIAEREPPYRITLRGSVARADVHGPKLELTTELSTSRAHARSGSGRGHEPRRAAAGVPDALPHQFRPAPAGGRVEAAGARGDGDAVQRPRGQGRQAVRPVRRPHARIHRAGLRHPAPGRSAAAARSS